MIILHQNHVVQTRTVVHAAASEYRGLFQCAQSSGRLACVQYFCGMTSDGIHELPRQRCDAAEVLKKIQRHAFGFENRARKAAQLNDNVASDYGSAIRLMDLDIRRGIDLPENFRSRRGAGNNGWFPSNDAPGCVQPLGNEKLGGDIPVADIFFKRGRDRIVILRVHG